MTSIRPKTKIHDLVLLTPERRPTEDFIRAWSEAGAKQAMSGDLVLATEGGTPTVAFVNLWKAAWGTLPAKGIWSALALFDRDGRFTGLGVTRWSQATR